VPDRYQYSGRRNMGTRASFARCIRGSMRTSSAPSVHEHKEEGA
jgi:hypothetical protein